MIPVIPVISTLIFGLLAPLPYMTAQLILSIAVSILVWLDPDDTIAGCDTILVFIFTCKHFIQLLDGTLTLVYSDSKPLLWGNWAPYIIHDNYGTHAYGYAMVQFRVKKKSGHARPKSGGVLQPLTTFTMTHWLSHTSFGLALAMAIYLLVISIIWTIFEKILDILTSHIDEKHDVSELLDNSERADTEAEFDERCPPGLKTVLLKPFHMNFLPYLSAYLRWRSYVDTSLSLSFPDEDDGEFETENLVSWQFCHNVCRED